MATLYGRVGGSAGAGAAEGRTDFQTYLSRVVAMIPAEAIAVFLVGKGFATDSTLITEGIWAVICWVIALVLRWVGMLGPGKVVNMVFVLLAFPVWVFAMGSPILTINLDAGTASLTVLVLAVAGSIFFNVE